jgi:tetratricopeptide (TPR) repeat protein
MALGDNPGATSSQPANFQEEKRNLIKSAFIYSQEGKWSKAIEAYEKLVEMDPEDYNAFNALGEMYSKRGLFLEAFDKYLKAAGGYERQGNSHRAGNVYRKAARLDLSSCDMGTRSRQDLITRLSIAQDAVESEENEKAMTILQEAHTSFPDSMEVKQRLAELYVATGRVNEAAELYWQVTDFFITALEKMQALKTAQRILSLDPSHEGAKKVVEELYPKEA